MNGFEPLRRRIIDYTVAGQWSEVYDGPIEGCETEQLKAENAKLRNQLEEQKCFAADLEKDVRALRELVRDMMRHSYTATAIAGASSRSRATTSMTASVSGSTEWPSWEWRWSNE